MTRGRRQTGLTDVASGFLFWNQVLGRSVRDDEMTVECHGGGGGGGETNGSKTTELNAGVIPEREENE